MAFLTGSFSKALIVADYYLNTASYAKDCINKAKPMMHCNGQCQMMKKLRTEEKKDAENRDRREDAKNEVVSSRSFFPELHSLNIILIRANIPGHLNQTGTCSMPRAYFHPPSSC